MQRRICLAGVLARMSHAEEELFSGGVFQDKLRGEAVRSRVFFKDR